MSAEPTVRVAMWSGPRNIPTAMMRSFGARQDCAVTDEPFYAAYLVATGLLHPMRDEVVASQPTDWHAVAAALVRAPPQRKRVWYQKYVPLDRLRSRVDRSRRQRLISSARLRRSLRRMRSSAMSSRSTRSGSRHRWSCSTARPTGSVARRRGSSRKTCSPIRAECSLRCARPSIFRSIWPCWHGPPGRRATDGAWVPVWYHRLSSCRRVLPRRARRSGSTTWPTL